MKKSLPVLHSAIGLFYIALSENYRENLLFVLKMEKFNIYFVKLFPFSEQIKIKYIVDTFFVY